MTLEVASETNRVVRSAEPVADVTIDIGCGSNKKPGAVGLDIRQVPGVDHVVDFTKERLPFDDSTVSRVYSSHCIEHLPDPIHIFKEMTRVARHGATLELWVPYGWHDTAFLWDHRTVWNEEWFMHIGHSQVWFWQPKLGARWRLREVIFAIDGRTRIDLLLNATSVPFALKHMKNVCTEMGVKIEIDKLSPVPAPGESAGAPPPRYYTEARDHAQRTLIAETRADKYIRFRRRLSRLLRGKP
jgi:SAM-dependent methyltransferase